MSSDINIDAEQFVNILFGGYVSDQETVCLAKPTSTGFKHFPATPRKLSQIQKNPDEYYICVSSVAPQEPLRRRQEDCVNAWALMLDDVGTKARKPPVEPTFALETSKGNFQYVYAIDLLELKAQADKDYFEACTRGLANAGYCDPGAQGITRLFRIPGSVNKKPGRDGWKTRITHYNDMYWFLPDLMQELGIEPVYKEKKSVTTDLKGSAPVGTQDPVLNWLAEQGLLGERRDTFYDVQCPWADQHTTGSSTAGYSALGQGDFGLLRGFHCFHGHCEDKTAHDFLAWVQASGGPGCSVSGVNEIEADKLTKYVKEFTDGQRISVLYASLPAIYKKNLPDHTKTPKGAPAASQKLTRPNVQYMIDALGVNARMNMQNHRVEVDFNDNALNTLILNDNEAIRTISDTGTKLGMPVSDSRFSEILGEVAAGRRYHPMAEWIQSVPWDKTPRLNALADAVQVPRAFAILWPLYLRRWLLQVVQAVHGWDHPRQMRGCIVLSGAQNIGKSRFFASLVPDQFFLEGAHLELHGPSAKDCIMQVTAQPIVELGELETTFSKSASGQLKAFLSQSSDTYRAPYDPRAQQWPRCTVFCGTVNKIDFLMDDTGSSRFWPVPVRSVNPDHGIDMQQLWGEVYAWWRAGETWWLTPEEDAQRAAASSQFEVTTSVREAVESWLDTHKMPGTALNATGFAKLLGIHDSRQNLSEMRGILESHLGPRHNMLRTVRKAWDIPTTQK